MSQRFPVNAVAVLELQGIESAQTGRPIRLEGVEKQ